jgi:hypothetical protein
MHARGIFSGCILTLVLAVPSIHGQNAPGSNPGPSVGLLLAYVSHQRDLEWADIPFVVQYKTLLVVSNALGTRIVATLPDIIVPRKAGFWRIGIEHTCQFTPPEHDAPPFAADEYPGGTINTEDAAYAVPVDKPPVVEFESPLCDSETAKRVLDGSYVSYSSSSGSSRPYPAEECGGHDIWVKSVLPGLVSFSVVEDALCAHGRSNYMETWVQNLDDPIAPFETIWDAGSTPSSIKIRFDQLFGPAGRDAWVRAVSPIQDEALGPCGRDLDPSAIPEAGWNLEHVQGGWRTDAYVNVDGDCEGLGHPNIAVPSSVAHAAPLPVPWTELEKQLPGISDAYFSPRGSVMLVIQSAPGPGSDETHVTSVGLFDFSAGKTGRKLLDLPPSDVVMAEWATGPVVKNWTDSLTALQTRGLPPVVLKPEASSR